MARAVSCGIVSATNPTATGGGGTGNVVVECVASDSGANPIALTNNATVNIPFDTDDYDPAGYHDPVTNNHRFVVPTGKAGYHRFSAQLDTDLNYNNFPSHNWASWFALNAFDLFGREEHPLPTTITLALTTTSPFVLLADGDVVIWQFFHNAGFNGSADTHFYQAARLVIERLSV